MIHVDTIPINVILRLYHENKKKPLCDWEVKTDHVVCMINRSLSFFTTPYP